MPKRSDADDPTPSGAKRNDPGQGGLGAADEASGSLQNVDRHLAPEDAEEMVTSPLNPPPERRSQRKAQRDERPGS